MLDSGEIVMPLGMSFYTLTAIGYIVDVYRGRAQEQSFFRLALLLSYFPTLIQGPILKARDSLSELCECRGTDSSGLRSGVLRILYGYFKKLVVADTVAIAVRFLLGLGSDIGGGQVPLLILLYTVQVYCDFSGGVDIALGLSEMLGIALPENFDMPFLSVSVGEYWRRWHITLGAWLGEYIFYPLSLCRPMQRLSASCRRRFGINIGKRVPVYISAILTWLLSGLWHGLGLNFIVWGVSNCVFILISQELDALTSRRNRIHLEKNRLLTYARRLGTATVVGIFRLLDIYGSVPLTLVCLFGIFRAPGASGHTSDGMVFGLSAPEWTVVCLGVLAVSLVGAYRVRRGEKPAHSIARSPWATYVVSLALSFAVLIFGAYGIGYNESGFIYNQF